MFVSKSLFMFIYSRIKFGEVLEPQTAEPQTVSRAAVEGDVTVRLPDFTRGRRVDVDG